MNDPAKPAATPSSPAPGANAPGAAPAPASPATSAPASAAAPSTISIDDFLRLDLRIATIRSAEFHPNADKLLKLQLDDGTPQGRQVCAGIRQWYDPAALIGRQVVIVANLAPRTIRGEISQGMVLCASDLKDASPGGAAPPERDVVALMPDRAVKPGSKVS